MSSSPEIFCLYVSFSLTLFLHFFLCIDLSVFSLGVGCLHTGDITANAKHCVNTGSHFKTCREDREEILLSAHRSFI